MHLKDLKFQFLNFPKKEIKEYYDLYHVELLKSMDYETMIILASKMIRIGINKDWSSKWYAENKDFAKYLKADSDIRNYLSKKLTSISK